ncbi:MAG: hypothetical protein J6J27_03170 [Alphaproteobacteria bacterium]|nr:hypothetical protein [Alphaproteobacteria bacterium]
MKRRSSFLTILTLILAGILVFPTDYADAKKSNTARKSSSKKKKKNKSKKKTETVTVNVAEDTSEARASSSSSRRGGTTTTTTTTTTATVVDEATEISNLKSNLLSCLSGQCAGDVSYEKCFKTSNIDVFLAGNPSCQSYLNSASSETVRVLAKQQVVSKVKDYFKESCANAGGKISGETCKLSIYYLAKSPDGKSKVKRDKTVSVGTTFTCSYNNFGLSQQNLEYKAEQSAEDKIAGIQAMIQLGTGLLSTGAQVVGAINAQKNLKRAGAFVEDAWYKFDGTNLTDSKPDNKYWYGASGVGLKRAEEDQCDGEKGVDDNGAKYCRYSADSFADNYGLPKSKTSSEGEDCSTLTAETFKGKEKCYVYIEKSNELKKAEKLKELISKLKDLSALKAEAAEAQDNINFARNYIAPTYVAQASTLFTPGATLNVGVADAVCSSAMRYLVGDPCSTCQNKIDVRSLDDANKKYILDNGATSNFECHNDISGSGYSCADRSKCHWDSKQGWLKTVDKQGSSSGGESDGTGISSLEEELKMMKSNAKDYRDGLKFLMTGDEDDKKSIKDYNSAVSSYNSANNTVNEKKKEMEQLKEQSSSALQSAISSGTQTALTGITTLVTSKISADANKGIMTGACYLGDPDAGGSMLMNDGEVKKLNWKLFN